MPSRRLAAGQRIVQPATDAVPAVAAAPAGEDRWVSGMPSCTDVPLGQVVDQANRYSTAYIHVPHGATDLRVTGSFRSGDNAEIARTLADIFGLPLTHDDDGGFTLGDVGLLSCFDRLVSGRR